LIIKQIDTGISIAHPLIGKGEEPGKQVDSPEVILERSDRETRANHNQTKAEIKCTAGRFVPSDNGFGLGALATSGSLEPLGTAAGYCRNLPSRQEALHRILR
jgi:hypothetical protein